jgi:hypothetical protein
MSVVENLNRIKSCKENIKQAIINKGVDMTGVAFEGYADKISQIEGGGGTTPTDYLEYKSNFTSYSSEATEIPEAAFYGCTSLATVNLPNVWNIPIYAFRRCSGLTSVNVPTCGALEPNAFEGCASLTAIDLPNCGYMNPDCFRDCTSLTTVNLPVLQTVGSYGFVNCTSLTAIDLPNCNILQNGAFSGCNNLASVNLPNCLEIQSDAFKDCWSLTSLDLPNCEKIYDNGLVGTNITSVSIPKCKEIGSYAFDTSNNLTSITATACEKIHEYAFQCCGALPSIELPNCVGISSNAFWFCSSLVSVSIPNCGVISNGAFAECYALSELDLSHTYYCRMDDLSAFNATPLMNGTGVIKVHKSVLSQFQSDEYWSAFAAIFVGVGEEDEILLAIDSDGKVYGETFGLYDGYLDYLGVSNESVISIDLPNVASIYSDTGMGMFAWYPNIQTVKLPKVKTMEQPAFQGCGALTSVELPNCTNIANETFADCFNLQTVDLTNCDTVFESAFRNCVNMKSVELPNCNYVSNNAFEGCLLLESVSLPNCTVIGMNVFANCTNLKTLTIGTNKLGVCTSFGELNIPESVEAIFVPEYLVDSYKSDWAWGQYADKIFAVGSNPNASDWYVVGNFNGWTILDPNTQMIKENGWNVLRNLTVDGQNVIFVKGMWEDQRHAVGDFTGVGEAVSLTVEGNDIIVPAGTYDVYLNSQLDTAYFMEVGQTPF